VKHVLSCSLFKVKAAIQRANLQNIFLSWPILTNEILCIDGVAMGIFDFDPLVLPQTFADVSMK
jgi:hypothetical protein